MDVKTENDLPEFHRANWLKAMSAMQLKNYGYAIQLLQTLLKSHPGFLSARQLVREAAIAKTAGKKTLLSTASFSALKLQSQVRKDPVAALDAIEKSLESEPTNPQLNHLLKEAALIADMPDIAAFALETILKGAPKDIKVMHELAGIHMGLNPHLKDDEQKKRGPLAPEKALEVYNKILKLAPNDIAAVKGAKDAAAADSMLSGGWNKEETTYRDLIKDKDLAVSLEQQSRVVRSDEMIENLLEELHAKAEAEPASVDTARRIAELYEQKEDLENAANWFQYAASLTNNSDMALVRKASDLQIRQFDIAIESREEFIAANPGTPESDAYTAELESLKTQRAELSLLAARTRVEQNPTDLQLRFELGELLVESGNWQEAIPELQKARQNPSVRIRAMCLLGQCFTARNMLDLAAKTLSDAVSELLVMDAVKKDVIYNLGLVYEKMGDLEKSVESMKQIYEVDYGYRDVAARVESSY